MTTFKQLDRALAAKGWRYDVDNEQFMNGKHPLNYHKVLALMPGMTLDELASYQDQKYDARNPSMAKQRTAKKKAAKKMARKKAT